MEKDNAIYIAKDVMLNTEISPRARMLYVHLCSFCDGLNNRTCHPSVNEILKRAKMSRNTFYKYIQELEQKGIVKKYYEQTGTRPLDRQLHYHLCE